MYEYDKRLNEMHFVTLGKQWNPFPNSPRTSLGELTTLPQTKVHWEPPIPYQTLWFLPRCVECRRGLAMTILLSVRHPSVCQTRGLWQKTEEQSVQIFTPYKKSFSLVFWEQEWLRGKFWVKATALERNRRFSIYFRPKRIRRNT